MAAKRLFVPVLLLLMGLAGLLFVSLRPSLAARLPGQIVVMPDHPQWLARYPDRPFFMCGPGDPEGFLYRGARRADGARDGDQEALIRKLAGTGANCIYLIAVRSHGGDGDPTQNPFVDNDPTKGLNPAVLDQWERWFNAMDRAGIVIYFFFYDDSARVWNTGDRVCAAEKAFFEGLVNRFEHHKNLIWCLAEEYQEALTPRRAHKLAAIIRAADDHDHVIAVHKLPGTSFAEFADDPYVDQFAMQLEAGEAEAYHRAVVSAWQQAQGRYNVNMAEAPDFGTGQKARRTEWACAMGGAYVMVIEMDIASTPRADLEDCGRLVHFFERTDFWRMAPHDELALGATKYVLARPGHSYIAYRAGGGQRMGLRDMAAGAYVLVWFDCATGKTIRQTHVRVRRGDNLWPVPLSLGDEVALYVKRTG
ncbi:MAG: hypothetical protein J7M26_00715 [Armatimonadetes bacterium]|nr:hypothetical protein [Armatimonadota bacterium]